MIYRLTLRLPNETTSIEEYDKDGVTKRRIVQHVEPHPSKSEWQGVTLERGDVVFVRVSRELDDQQLHDLYENLWIAAKPVYEAQLMASNANVQIKDLTEVQ